MIRFCTRRKNHARFARRVDAFRLDPLSGSQFHDGTNPYTRAFPQLAGQPEIGLLIHWRNGHDPEAHSWFKFQCECLASRGQQIVIGGARLRTRNRNTILQAQIFAGYRTQDFVALGRTCGIKHAHRIPDTRGRLIDTGAQRLRLAVFDMQSRGNKLHGHEAADQDQRDASE